MPPVTNAPELSARDRARSAAERAAIDASCRGPVLLFASAAVFWLLAGTALALVASVKLHSPYFLTGTAELTFGRVRMAHLQAVGIGWASLASVAGCLWLMCRLSRAELLYPKMLYLSGALWNIGTALAVFGIIFGDGQSVEWLDAPPYAAPFFIAALGIVSAWTVATFRRRRGVFLFRICWLAFRPMASQASFRSLADRSPPLRVSSDFFASEIPIRTQEY